MRRSPAFWYGVRRGLTLAAGVGAVLFAATAVFTQQAWWLVFVVLYTVAFGRMAYSIGRDSLVVPHLLAPRGHIARARMEQGGYRARCFGCPWVSPLYTGEDAPGKARDAAISHVYQVRRDADLARHAQQQQRSDRSE